MIPLTYTLPILIHNVEETVNWGQPRQKISLLYDKCYSPLFDQFTESGTETSKHVLCHNFFVFSHLKFEVQYYVNYSWFMICSCYVNQCVQLPNIQSYFF